MSADMEYKVFYTCYGTNDTVESSKPYTADRDNMVAIAQQVLRADGDFFGMVDENGVTLQFMRQEDDRIWMEIPVPSEGGSYGRRILVSDLERVLLSVVPPLNPVRMNGLEFKQW